MSAIFYFRVMGRMTGITGKCSGIKSKLGQIAISVSDYEKATKFYEEP